MRSALTQGVARLLLAPTFIVAAAVIVKGYSDVGDGFAAGVIAALGVLTQYLAFGASEARRLPLVRSAPVVAGAGLLVALAVALFPLAFGEEILSHRPEPGADVVRLGTLELLTAVVFDVGVFLLVLGAAVAIIDAVALRREAPR